MALKHLEKADLEIRKFKIEIDDQSLELANVEKELATKKKLLVKDIDVYIRIIEAGNHKYQLISKGTMISEKITMYVDAKDYKENSSFKKRAIGTLFE